jgi:hypothetical protein
LGFPSDTIEEYDIEYARKYGVMEQMDATYIAAIYMFIAKLGNDHLEYRPILHEYGETISCIDLHKDIDLG